MWQIESTFRVRYHSFSFVQAKTPKSARWNCWVSGYFFSSLAAILDGTVWNMNYCATAIELAKEKETDGEEDAEMKSLAVIHRLGSVCLFSLVF